MKGYAPRECFSCYIPCVIAELSEPIICSRGRGQLGGCYSAVEQMSDGLVRGHSSTIVVRPGTDVRR